MTLHTQNKLLLGFSIASALTSVLFIVTGIARFIESPDAFLQLLYDPITGKDFTLLQLLTEDNRLNIFLSLAVFSLCTPIAGFAVYFSFEKTKSPEIIYYIAILVGIFAESLRLCIPLFASDGEFSGLIRTVGKFAFFGQMQVILAILILAVVSVDDESRDSHKYSGVISVVSLIFAMIIPMNTINALEYFSPQYAFESLFTVIRIIFIVACFFAMFFSPKSKKSPDYKKASQNFFITCAGYALLLHCTSFIVFFIGLLFFIVGTAQFLKNLHNYYMWK
ncbi:MAG: hypothetical protein R3Y36_04080 [Spirochaetales bacterium]